MPSDWSIEAFKINVELKAIMFETRVLQIQDIGQITQFEREHLRQCIADEVEQELASWHASWRQESLEYYLPLGWSFGIWQNSQLVGYFLAQPLLFSRGLTQTLWVERLVAKDEEGVIFLIDHAYRMSREKHFQQVLFLQHEDMNYMHPTLRLEPIADRLLGIKAAKY